MPEPNRAHLRLVTSAPAEEAAWEDDRLVRAFLAGERAAFEGLVRRHQGTVQALVRRYARSPEDTADLCQRAFLRAFEAARRSFSSRSPGPLPFRAWVLRIAVNLAKNQARDERRRPRAPLEAAPEPAAPQPSALASLEEREQRERVQRAVLQLPRREREVFGLRIDGELPFAEVAQVLGITENNAKVCFHHAVRRLQKLVAESAESP